MVTAGHWITHGAPRLAWNAEEEAFGPDPPLCSSCKAAFVCQPTTGTALSPVICDVDTFPFFSLRGRESSHYMMPPVKGMSHAIPSHVLRVGQTICMDQASDTKSSDQEERDLDISLDNLNQLILELDPTFELEVKKSPTCVSPPTGTRLKRTFWFAPCLLFIFSVYYSLLLTYRSWINYFEDKRKNGNFLTLSLFPTKKNPNILHQLKNDLTFGEQWCDEYWFFFVVNKKRLNSICPFYVFAFLSCQNAQMKKENPTKCYW